MTTKEHKLLSNFAEKQANAQPEKTSKSLTLEDKLLQYYPAALKNVPQPATIPQSEYFNYLAIQLLEEAGNAFPTQEAIDFVESLLERQGG